MNPKISVIMSAYNAEKFIEEAVESILRQTFTDFEFIIIDDASSDKTPSILRNFSYKDPRIKIITNEKNLGLTKSLNLGIENSRGEYIARMDADDISFPERFEKQVKFLDENKETGVVGAWAKVIDEEGKEIDEFDYEEIDSQTVRKELIKSNVIIHPLAMIRKSVLEKVGGYDESFQYAQDYDLWFRIEKVSEIQNLPLFLMNYRISRKSITSSKNNKQSLCALRAQWYAIKRGQYSILAIFYLFRSVLSIILPKTLKDLYK